MGKKIRTVICTVLIVIMLMPAVVYARRGDCGYEGGISSGEIPDETTLEYQEICFVTGEPILLKGTVTIKKSLKQDTITSTYNYKLENTDRSVTLNRVLSYNTEIVNKDNGQTVEQTSLSRTPTEVIRVGELSYILRDYNFTRTSLIDKKPAIDYFAGNTWGKKRYEVRSGTDTGNITVETTGNFYGYDQYWGTTEAIVFNYIIESEQKKGEEADIWGGTASVSISCTTTKQLNYIENQPYQISFDGGYVQTQYNNSIMEYSCRFPEFDTEGISTDNMKTKRGSLQIESFPIQQRLPVDNLTHLRGHWAENDIKVLYALEVFKGDSSVFNPDRFITRAEFAAAIVEAAKEVPEDPALVSKIRTNTRTYGRRNAKEEEVVSPFIDVAVDNKYFEAIKSAYERGIINGKTHQYFSPDGEITVADAITVFIRALGLESLAPNPAAVTTFKDNDKIPEHARAAVYVAQKIGLINGDERGYLSPNEPLTKARAAALINRFINYMRWDIRKDYRERIVNYN